jgi:hypothetical protein
LSSIVRFANIQDIVLSIVALLFLLTEAAEGHSRSLRSGLEGDARQSSSTGELEGLPAHDLRFGRINWQSGTSIEELWQQLAARKFARTYLWSPDLFLSKANGHSSPKRSLRTSYVGNLYGKAHTFAAASTGRLQGLLNS